jgi:c-di-GMP-binding flagellar brake protein YcgR
VKKNIKCRMFYATSAHLLNISVGGACLQVDRRVRIGNEYTLHLGSEGTQLTLKGRVVREVLSEVRKNKRGEAVPFYEVGIQFENVLTSPGRDLISFIEETTQNSHQRVRIRGTRVRILDAASTTLLDVYNNYRIKKLSMGGLLMETDQMLEADHAFDMELQLREADPPLKVRARIANCESIPGKVPPVYDTGIEFLRISREDIQRLSAFIADLSKEEKTKRH